MSELLQLRAGGSSSRRDFLARCAACAACAVCPGIGRAQQQPQDRQKPRIRLVYVHIPPDKPTWPYQGFDYEGRKKELTSRLTAACPGVQFLGPATIRNRQEAHNVLEGDSEVDGYLVYMIGLWSGGGSMVIAESGKPTLFVDDLYAGSGEFLTAYSAARRRGLRVAPVSSSRFDDVVQAVKAFECLKRLRSAVILDVVDRDPGAIAQAIRDVFGARVQRVTSEELNSAYTNASATQAQNAADTWIKSAERIVEPTKEEIGKSGRMYVGMRDLMRRHGADAFAIDCLTLYYGDRLPAYPCLGLMQFNDDGFVGACEADLDSTITMLAMTYLVERPGFISDPVIDTARNQIIYAHCVAPTKVYGPKGPASPFHIRSHSEDRRGAAVRALLPLSEMTPPSGSARCAGSSYFTRRARWRTSTRTRPAAQSSRPTSATWTRSWASGTAGAGTASRSSAT